MSASLERVVVIGNGMAGQATLDELVRVNKRMGNDIDIVVFGEEPNPCYNRIMLSDVLAGKRVLAQLFMKKRDWYEENNVKLYTGSPVTEIDSKNCRVRTSNGFSSPYDKLLIATGSYSFIPPIKGTDKKGIYGYRTINDVWNMVETARYKKNAVVIGGGLLGLEAAKALLDCGMDVTVVHLLDRLMEQQLDYDSASILKQQLENMGLKFEMQGVTEEILGEDHATGVRLQSGRTIDADLVIVCTGIRPNVELADKTGILVNRGIVVNDYMETSEENIYGVGECVEHRGTLYGLYEPLVEQSRVVADSMVGENEKVYEGSLISAVLKVAGIDLVSIGNFLGDEDSEDLVLSDPEYGVYKKIVLKADKVTGAIFLGDVKDFRNTLKLIREGTDVTGKRQELLFGDRADETVTVNSDGAENVDDDDLALYEIPLVPDNPDYASSEFHTRLAGIPWLAKVNPMEIKAEGMEVDFERYRKEGFSAIGRNDFLKLKSHGYCSQKQEEFFMRRVRVPGGQITAPQLNSVADLAEKYGGWLHITTRQALELHWTKIDDVEIDEALANVGLSTRSACGHAIRNVTCSETAGIDADEVMDVRPWVKIVHDYIVNYSSSINRRLPRKMNVYLANSPKYRSHALVNDLGFVAIEATLKEETVRGFEVWIGGSLGSSPHLSHKLIDFVPPEQTIPVLQTIIDIYARHGNVKGSKNPRLKALIDEWGFDRFREEFHSLYFAKHQPLIGLEILNTQLEAHDEIGKEGVYPQKQEGYYRVVVRVPLGELTAKQSKTISRLCLEYSDGKIQNTMQQNIEFHWVKEAKLDGLLKELAKLGLDPHGANSILDVQACPGTTYCIWGVSNSQSTGDSLIRHIEEKGYVEDDEIRQLKIQISGCPNSCAQHQVADIGLSGSGGKYFLYLGGHMNGTAKVGEIVRRNILPEEINHTVDAVLELYLEMREAGEKFIGFVNRIGTEQISDLLSNSLDSPEALEKRAKAEQTAKVESENAADREYSVKFKLSGRTIKIKGTETILEKALDEDIPIPFSCQEGICGTCKVRVRGKFHQGDVGALTPEEAAKGEALLCMAKPRGNMEVEA